MIRFLAALALLVILSSCAPQVGASCVEFGVGTSDPVLVCDD